MKAFWKFILVKDIEENVVEKEPELLTQEEIDAEEATGIPTPQPNIPDIAFARLVEIVNIWEDLKHEPLPLAQWTKIYIPHYAWDIIDEGIRIIGINSVLAIAE